MGNDQQIQGTLYWSVADKGSLVEIARKLSENGELSRRMVDSIPR